MKHHGNTPDYEFRESRPSWVGHSQKAVTNIPYHEIVIPAKAGIQIFNVKYLKKFNGFPLSRKRRYGVFDGFRFALSR
jgi:hypothetical protein